MRWCIARLLLVLLAAAGCNLSTPPAASPTPTFGGPPRISIASPLPEQVFLAGTVVIVQAQVENAGPDLARVSVLLDDALLGEELDPNPTAAAQVPLMIDWPSTTAGRYEFTVSAERRDGTASRETVRITVVEAAQPAEPAAVDDEPAPPTAASAPSPSPTISRPPAASGGAGTAPPIITLLPTPTAASDAASEPSQPSEPSEQNAPAEPPPANATVPNPFAPPMAKVITGANVRSGPSTLFSPPLGSTAADAEFEILAVTPNRDWYKIRYGGESAWIYADLVTTTGNVAGLIVDPGPQPTATPLPPTPLPTATAASAVNLIVGRIVTNPHPLVCGTSSEVQVTIRNDGAADAPDGGLIRVQAILVSSGAVLETTQTAFPALAAGESRVSSAFITVNSNSGEEQVIRAVVDFNAQVAESNENDNMGNDQPYYLSGDC